MSEPFDAYYQWLGIPPKYQPPDHYRLLGLERFEEDREVIRGAVDRQIRHVRSFQLGPHSDVSQQLLNELASAKGCLLDPPTKARYDEALRAETHVPLVITAAVPRQGGKPLLLGLLAGIAILCVVVLAVWRLSSPGPSAPPKQPSGVLVFDWPAEARREAVLTIDNVKVEIPPSGTWEHACPPGSHRVSVQRPGYRPWEQRVSVADGQRMDVSPGWEPICRLVLLWSEHERAQALLTIDGVPVELAKAALTQADRLEFELAPGLHEVSCQRPQYEPFRQKIEIGTGETRLVAIAWKRLVPPPAVYQVTIEPAGASLTAAGTGVSIEGQGPTRTVTIAEPDGQRQVMLLAMLSAHEPVQHPLTPRPGEKQSLSLRLNPLQAPKPVATTPEPETVKMPSGEREIVNSIGMKLVLIPAGEFLMGSPDSEKDRQSGEGPQHRVRITKPFYLGQYEVTQGEYTQVMGKNPSYFSRRGKGTKDVYRLDTERLPVEQVSWDDAVEFCRRLAQKEGRTYRLPTEAEWEYACRGGTTTPFSFGSVLNGREANCVGNKPYGTSNKGPYLQRTTTVGSYRPNAFGLYDMHGNVWEWCVDWYDDSYYTASHADDPSGPSSGSSRVLRGGSWVDYASSCRSADRYDFVPTARGSSSGFRVACGVAVSLPSR